MKATSFAEIDRIATNYDNSYPVEILLTTTEGILFQKYLIRLTDYSKQSVSDEISFVLLQLKLLVLHPKLGALTPLYHPGNAKSIEFCKAENDIVRVIFNPFKL
ncbi:MAG: hypothetical protein V4633_24195 [Pseudomonadota bacterium]